MGNFLNVRSENNNGNISIKSDLVYYRENFIFTDVMNSKEYKRFIKAVEKIVRGAKEYDKYLATIKERYIALNYDNIFKNVNSEGASIEMHHYPFTLYDICDTVVSYNIWNNKAKTSFNTAKEILELHFKNKIGLVPLSRTTHELVHDGKLFISDKQIFGDWKWFRDKYKSVLTPEMLVKLSALETLSKKDTATDFTGLLNLPQENKDNDK